ncbi:hypothetical protein BJ912DRAFT_1063988 [Pholiota molesta]|nr:hypothetical protein BJ912DRAFT_1063988 [Pholiota molesta]
MGLPGTGWGLASSPSLNPYPSRGSRGCAATQYRVIQAEFEIEINEGCGPARWQMTMDDRRRRVNHDNRGQSRMTRDKGGGLESKGKTREWEIQQDTAGNSIYMHHSHPLSTMAADSNRPAHSNPSSDTSMTTTRWMHNDSRQHNNGRHHGRHHQRLDNNDGSGGQCRQ